jgi:large subunit ribosomal protein L32e
MAEEKKAPAREKVNAAKKPDREKTPVAAKRETGKPAGSSITLEAVKKARKAELVEFCKELGLNTEGKVDELRHRLLEHLEKHPPRAQKKAKSKDEKEEGTVEIKEEGAYVPKIKPAASEERSRQLALRDRIARKRPTFLRQEWFRYKKLGLKWRKPQGGQSKLRRHFKYRINVVSIGFRGPKKTRGLHPSGFMEILVHNPAQLESVDPAKEAVRIAHAVGMRKRKLIEEAAAEKGVRVLNRSGSSGS